MKVLRLNIVVLAVAAYLSCIGCQPAIQPSVENQKSCPQVQKRDSPKLMRLKLDDDSFRMRLLMVELVQKNLRLTADQIRELKILCDTHKTQARELNAKLLEIYPPSQSLPQEEFEVRKPRFHELSQDLKSENKKFRNTSAV